MQLMQVAVLRLRAAMRQLAGRLWPQAQRGPAGTADGHACQPKRRAEHHHAVGARCRLAAADAAASAADAAVEIQLAQLFLDFHAVLVIHVKLAGHASVHADAWQAESTWGGHCVCVTERRDGGRERERERKERGRKRGDE